MSKNTPYDGVPCTPMIIFSLTFLGDQVFPSPKRSEEERGLVYYVFISLLSRFSLPLAQELPSLDEGREVVQTSPARPFLGYKAFDSPAPHVNYRGSVDPPFPGHLSQILAL